MSAVVALLLVCPTCLAQEWGRLYPTMTLASEYRFDGVSNSSGEPALQASIYWWRPDHFYAGVFATSVDFRGFYDPDTSYEIDLYAGYNLDLGAAPFEAGGDATRLSFEVMYTVFPDQGPAGPTYNFVQFTGRAQHRTEALTLRAELSFVPEASFGAGRAVKVEGGIAYRAADWLKASGEIGFRDVERGADRLYWDAGATVTIGAVDLDVRYHDTDLDFVACGFSANCGPSVVVKASWNLWK